MFPLLAIAAAQFPHDAFLTYHRGYLSSPGGCISETGNTGTYSELWGKTEAECRGECDASALCLGYEFSVVKVERYRLCELHSVLPTDAVPVPGAACHVKDTDAARAVWVAKGRRHAAFGAAAPPSKGAGGGGGGTASCAQDRAFNLGGAVRNGENLQDARLGGKFLSRASFQSAYLVGATLAGATATDASFVNANMERANLEALHGAGADFSAAMLKGANFGNAALSKATFSGANLIESRFDGASLYRASLDKADLSKASLAGADFSRANLKDANFESAALVGASFYGADVSGCSFKGADVSSVDWSHSRGLGTVNFLSAVGAPPVGQVVGPAPAAG